MYNKKKVKVGDVLQHRIKGKGDWLGHVINFFSLGGTKHGYSHTAIYIGNGIKAEAHMGKQFGAVVIQKEEFKWIDIYRLPKALNVKETKSILKATKELYGKNYDDLGLIGTVRSGLGKIFNWGWLRNSKPFFGDPEKYFCSEAVSKIYSEASKTWKRGVIDIAPKVNEQATTPADVSRSGVLKKIC